MSLHLERVLLLTKVPLFAYLRTDQLNRLVPLLEPVAWPKGVRVFDMGDTGLELYIIIADWPRMLRNSSRCLPWRIY